MISTGNLFYVYKNYGKKVDTSLFSDDPIIKNFLESLYKKTPVELQSWNEINGAYEEVIDLEAFNEKLLSRTLNKAVQDRQWKNLADINSGNYGSVLDTFPDLKEKLTSVGAVKRNIVPSGEIATEHAVFKPFFKEWDEVFKGLAQEDFITLIGIGGVGKSTNMKYIVSQAMKTGWSFAFIGAEENPTYILKGIYGFWKGLTPNQAEAYWKMNEREFESLKREYSNKLYINSSFDLNWGSIDEAFESSADIVILDNMQRFISAMGLEENQSSVSAVSRKLSSMVLKYKKPCFLVSQEAERAPTQKEFDKYPHITKIATGCARFSQALKQDSSMFLRIYQAVGQKDKEILVDKCRFRNLTNPWAEYHVNITNKATWITELNSDPSEIPPELLKEVKKARERPGTVREDLTVSDDELELEF